MLGRHVALPATGPVVLLSRAIRAHKRGAVVYSPQVRTATIEVADVGGSSTVCMGADVETGTTGCGLPRPFARYSSRYAGGMNLSQGRRDTAFSETLLQETCQAVRALL